MGEARKALEALSPEAAQKVAYQSALKKELALATKTTDKTAIMKELDNVTAELEAIPGTTTRTVDSQFPLVNEKYGDIIPNIGAKTTTTTNDVRQAVDNLASANADFSS